MPSHSGRFSLFPALFLAGALLTIATPLPAMAGDDGQAPIWVGLSSLLGLDDSKDAPSIQYGERGKLVLPPTMDLPAPSAAPVQNLATWPVDADLRKIAKKKEEKSAVVMTRKSAHSLAQQPFPTDSVVTIRSDAGQGPATKPCVTGSATRDCMAPGVSLFSMVGLGGHDDSASLGPEPDRDWLTDPPKGYRAPSGSAAAPTPAN
jgi:hypothetical protein